MQGKITRTKILMLAVTLIMGLALFSTITFAEKKSRPHQLTILFTGDDQGNIKPSCG